MERNEIVDQLEDERLQDQTEEGTDAWFDGEDEFLPADTPRSSSETSEGQNTKYMYFKSLHSPFYLQGKVIHEIQ